MTFLRLIGFCVSYLMILDCRSLVVRLLARMKDFIGFPLVIVLDWLRFGNLLNLEHCCTYPNNIHLSGTMEVSNLSKSPLFCHCLLIFTNEDQLHFAWNCLLMLTEVIVLLICYRSLILFFKSSLRPNSKFMMLILDLNALILNSIGFGSFYFTDYHLTFVQKNVCHF